MERQNYPSDAKSRTTGFRYSLWLSLVLTFIFFITTAILIYYTVDLGDQLSKNAEKIRELTQASNTILDTERFFADLSTQIPNSNSKWNYSEEKFIAAITLLNKNKGEFQNQHTDAESPIDSLKSFILMTAGVADSTIGHSNNMLRYAGAISACRTLSQIIAQDISDIRRDQYLISVRLDKYWFILSGIALVSCILALSTVISFHRYKVNADKIKAAEQEIFRQQETYRSLVENMNEGLIITDLEDCIVFANPAIEKLTGYKSELLLGRVFHKTFTNSSEWAGFQVKMNNRLQGLPEQYSSKLIRNDGTLLEVIINATTFRNHEGKITGTLGVISDLSERASFEKQIAAQRDNLAAVVENTDIYIWAFNHEFELLVFNSAFKEEYENLFGISAYYGMPVLDFVAPQLKRAWRRIAKKALSGEIVRLDQPYISDKGKRTYRVALNPIKTATGQITGVVAFMSDISLMKQAEEDLRQAKETAEEATKQKTVFLANMSHEIRTPLNGILGMAALMEDSELSSEQRLYISSIKESGALLLSLINEILDISKVEAGKIELIPAEFELLPMVDSISDMFTVQAENKGISFYIDAAPDLPLRIIGDSLRLQQIITNCLSNAFKFTASGYVELHIAPLFSESGECKLVLKITDTGKGMNEETRASIFEEYYQGNINTSKIYGGTGLGLSIARNFTKLMGGEINVESAENKGTVFTIVIPIQLPSEMLNFEPVTLSGDVLFVSNNNRGAKITEQLLVEARFKVITVYNAANAIVQINRAKTSGKKFAAVLTNYNLPGYDGFELCKQIVDLQPDHPTLFLLIGKRKAVHIRRQLSKCPVTVIFKPFYRNSIYQIVKTLQPKENDVDAKEFSTETSQNILRVLIADDNKINLTVLTGFLKKLGHYVHQVSNGAEAVEEFKSGEYDIILMDCNMPVLSGFEAAAQIRSLEKGTEERIPIIGVTAYNSPNEKEKCISSGMDDMLSKPFDIAELRRMLELNTVSSSVQEFSDSGFIVENERVIRLRESIDNETIDELLQLFLNDFQGYLASVSERISENNFEGLSEQSHTIKSGCANLGADKLWKYVEKLEHECYKLPPEEITLLFNKIADEFIYVKDKIRIYLADRV